LLTTETPNCRVINQHYNDSLKPVLPISLKVSRLNAVVPRHPFTATGRKAKWTVIIIGRFEGETLTEDWVEYDRYNLFRQFGAL
jgi:hypothetical protein